MLFAVCLIVGLGGTVAGIYTNPDRAWPNFLVSYFFFLMLGLSGAFFTALQHITNAYWSVTVRRLSEATMSYLPIAFVLGLMILFFGRHYLYEWTSLTALKQDEILMGKAGYLNSKFFGIRMLVYFAIWLIFGLLMVRNSVNQDANGDDRFTLSNIKLSAVFLPLFAISFTLFSFDLVMSLEPHWYSTIFGVYCFADLFLNGLAILAVLVVAGRRQGLFTDELINANHLHDIGKLLFAFTVFWGYIMFSQLMLQWYANLPEEIPYYMRRFHAGWWPFSIFLFVVHWVIPFFGLLPREAKRCDKYLGKMALFMLFGQWLDSYYMVMPAFFKDGPVIGWIEILTPLGFLGAFGISVGRFLERVPAVPLKDPRLAECLAHTQ
jgi:hypothetical protein